MKNKTIIQTNPKHGIKGRYEDNEKTKVPKTNVKEDKKNKAALYEHLH